MLNFRNTNILFGCIAVALITLDISGKVGIAWYVYLLVFVVYTLILFYGSASVSSNFYMPVLSAAGRVAGSPAGSGAGAKKQIAISFDDGPAEQFTPGILDILSREQVPAAFFCIGKNIAGHEEILQRIVSEQHLVGNHSYSHHFWFDLYGAEKMSLDLAEMNRSVEQVTGLRPALFRPPYGVTNPNLAKAVSNHGFTTIGWNIRSMDTVVKDDKKLLAKVLAAVKPGAIVLFHDTCEATFLILPAFIDSLKKQGYEFVRVDKLLNVAPYA